MRFGGIRCIISLACYIQAVVVPRHLPGCRIHEERHAGMRTAWTELWSNESGRLNNVIPLGATGTKSRTNQQESRWMQKSEDQTIEYKSSWQDDYFGWIAGYANAEGGTLYIGVNDDGYVIGVSDLHYLLDTLPNQINSHLGIIVSISHGSVQGKGNNLKHRLVPADIAAKPENLYARGILTTAALDDIDADPANTKNVTNSVQQLFDAAPGFIKQLRKSEDYRNKIRADLERIQTENQVYVNADGSLDYVRIEVDRTPYGVPYHGHYYKRSGGTTTEIKGAELSRFLLDKVGKTWDKMPAARVKIDHAAVDFFRKNAVEKGRLTEAKAAVSDELVIENLNLKTSDGEYTRAAAMLFADPEAVIFGAYLRIGFFKKNKTANTSSFAYGDEVHGPLVRQAEDAVDLIFKKYLKALADIEGLHRSETYPTNKEILREVILNAVAHKNYESCDPIQIKVFDDHITVMNYGFWPFEKLKVEDAYDIEHSSYPINPLITNGLFSAGLMDKWGQGFSLIKEQCGLIDAPLPEIKATDDTVTLTIRGCKKYMELLERLNSFTSSITGEGASEGVGEAAGEEADRLERVVAFCAIPRSRNEIQAFCNIKSDRFIRQEVIQLLLEEGRIVRTIPDKPSSPKQKYIATKTELERAQAIMDRN